MKYNSYYLYRKYEKRDSQDVLPAMPSVYSVDGEGTMPKVLHISEDPECGDIPPIYRWVNMDINTDYVCDVCSGEVVNYKIKGSSIDSTEFAVLCDSATTLYHRDIPRYTKTLIIGDCIHLIDRDTFEGGYDEYAGYLESIFIPSSIGTILDETFNNTAFYTYWPNYGKNLSYLTDCVVPTNLRVVGISAFTNCQTLENIILWDDVETLESHAFAWCHSLTTVRIPTSISKIPLGCYMGCSGLSSVYIPDNIEEIEPYAFSESSVQIIRGCGGVKTIRGSAFQLSELIEINFDNNSTLETIGQWAFGGCKNLTGITIPNRVTSIDKWAFSGCTRFTSIGSVGSGASVELPNSVTSIGFGSFRDCSGLTSISIPSGVTNIGETAFQNCTSLTGITIPNNVTNIGSNAFSDCSGFTSIRAEATTPPTLGAYAFDNTNNCPIYVPSGSVNAYKTAINWSRYESRIQAIP